MYRDGLKLSTVAIIWLCIIGALIVVMSIYAFIALKAQHDIVNPQVRQNMVDDSAKTIADRQDFHNKLSEIIAADQNVIGIINQIDKCEKMTPICANDDTLQNQLTGVEQIRNTTINAYNTKAVNPDDSRYLESWMPKKIDVTTIPAGLDDTRSFLLQEISKLQDIYNRGI